MFHPEELVSVALDGVVVHRGIWRSVQPQLKSIVATAFEDHLHDLRSKGVPEEQLRAMRRDGPRYDSVCIMAEGKGLPREPMRPSIRRF